MVNAFFITSIPKPWMLIRFTHPSSNSYSSHLQKSWRTVGVSTHPNTVFSFTKRCMVQQQLQNQQNQQQQEKTTNISSSSASASSTKSNVSQHLYENHHVMVKRNRQSMAFRNGSPLVFSGAIDSTLQVVATADTTNANATATIVTSTNIPNGALVAVRVNNNKSHNNKVKNNHKKNKRQSKMNDNNDIIHDTPPHYTLTMLDHNHHHDNDNNNNNNTKAKQLLDDSNIIGYGVYNPYSMYRVRILCHLNSHRSLFQQVQQILLNKHDHYQHHHTPNNNNDDDFISASASSSTIDQEAIQTIVRFKLLDAIAARKAMNLPSPSTDSYRLINGEGDGLSGLAVDILGGTVAVVMSSASWCELYKQDIWNVLQSTFNNHNNNNNNMQIVWRNTPSRLKQDGYNNQHNHPPLEINILSQQQQQQTQTQTQTSGTIVMENNIKYITYPFDTTSQKTGFYCDQRENRQWLAQYCKDKHVLDLCCFTGGFALHALLNGQAKSCVGVDSSPVAIQTAIQNAKLNGIPIDTNACSTNTNTDNDTSKMTDAEEQSKLQFVQADIAQFMKEYIPSPNFPNYYDVIILDPPKLAPTLAGLERAARKYHALNRDAIKLINPQQGGLLLTCTCSAAMTQKDGGRLFLETVKQAALAANRQITLLRSNSAASCHTQCPASFPAGAYLTASLFYVSPLPTTF